MPRRRRGTALHSRRSGHLRHPAAHRGRAAAAAHHSDHVRDLLPRAEAAPARPRTPWRRGTSGGPPVRSRSTRSRSGSGFTDPIYVQYGRFVKGLVAGDDLLHGHRRRALPGAVPRLLVHHPEPGAAGHPRPAAGDALARPRRGGPVARRRRLRRRALRAAAGKHLRPRRDERSRWPASRCRSSSPACCRCRSSPTAWAGSPAAARTCRSGQPGPVGLPPDPAVGHARLPLRRDLRAAHPGGHARDHARGLRAHRPGEGPARAHRRHQARHARRR